MKKTVIDIIVYIVVFLAIQAGAIFGIQTVWEIFSGSRDVTPTLLTIEMTAFSIITVAVFVMARWARPSRQYLLSRPWGALFWCALAAVGALVPSLWLQEQMPKLPDWSGEGLEAILNNRYGYVAVGLLAPIAEELVFRGAVLHSLLKVFRMPWVGIAISALIFAVIHGNPAQMPHAFLAGLLLGWMFYRTGSIAPGVVFHWVNNSAAYVLYHLLPDPEAPLVTLFGGSERHAHLAVIFSLCILIPSIYQMALRLKKP